MTIKKKGTLPFLKGSVPFSEAEGAAKADVARLVAAVPALMREADRRRARQAHRVPSLAQLAASALPRLAAATAAAVIAAAGYEAWQRSKPAGNGSTTAKTFESVVLEGDVKNSGDVVFDALLTAGRTDG